MLRVSVCFQSASNQFDWFMSWLPDVFFFSLKAVMRTAIAFLNLNTQCCDSIESALEHMSLA